MPGGTLGISMTVVGIGAGLALASIYQKMGSKSLYTKYGKGCPRTRTAVRHD